MHLATKIFLLPLAFSAVTALAGPREQAWRMFNRLNGVPPSASVLAEMEALISQGKERDAALLAMESPYFYNLALKNWVSEWTNVDGSPRVELNDYTATVIGIIRDDLPFDQVIHGDLIYTGRDGLTVPGGAAVPAYSSENNGHYLSLESGRIDLKANLVRREQSSLTGIADTAGVLTTRAAGEAFYSAGTNRRPLRFALMTYLCQDLEQLSDTTRRDVRIRRDVTRHPGGDPTVFRSKCAGCHTGMDALTGAFAYFDFNGSRLVHTPGTVSPKFNQNGSEFPDGYITADDSWINLWTEGTSARFGWPEVDEGQGVRELGRLLSQTQEFPRCMAARVFSRVCLREAQTDADRSTIAVLAKDFSDGGRFNMKQLFAATAEVCMAD